MAQALDREIVAVVAEHTPALLRGAMAMGFAPADCEELVQDTFVAYLQARERFEGRSSLKTFLFGILYNKGAELSRKRKKEPASEDIEAAFDSHFNAAGHWLAAHPKGPEDAALSKELAELISSCAERLSLEQRTAFFLKAADGAASEDICNALGVSDTHLRVLLFRARLKLRECLEKRWTSK